MNTSKKNLTKFWIGTSIFSIESLERVWTEQKAIHHAPTTNHTPRTHVHTKSSRGLLRSQPIASTSRTNEMDPQSNSTHPNNQSQESTDCPHHLADLQHSIGLPAVVNFFRTNSHRRDDRKIDNPQPHQATLCTVLPHCMCLVSQWISLRRASKHLPQRLLVPMPIETQSVDKFQHLERHWCLVVQTLGPF